MLNIHNFLYCGATVQTSEPCIKEGGIAQSVNQSNHYPVSCLSPLFYWPRSILHETQLT